MIFFNELFRLLTFFPSIVQVLYEPRTIIHANACQIQKGPTPRPFHSESPSCCPYRHFLHYTISLSSLQSALCRCHWTTSMSPKAIPWQIITPVEVCPPVSSAGSFHAVALIHVLSPLTNVSSFVLKAFFGIQYIPCRNVGGIVV